jgi:tRNA A37 threonylcarbamoyladenosine biosynthesis protein TsaE
VSWRSCLTGAFRREGGRRLAAISAVLGVSAVLALVAGLPRPTTAAAAGGPQFLERAPLVIPLGSLRSDVGKAGWAVQVVNPLPQQAVDTELRVVGPVAGWLSVRSPATVRIAPGAVATFRVIRTGSARAGSGELVLIAGGALDRRAIIITAPPKGWFARWRARLIALFVVVLLVALVVWRLARRGRAGMSRFRRHRSGAGIPEMPSGPGPLRLARNDGAGMTGLPPAPGLLYNDEPTTEDKLDRKKYAEELARLAREAQPPLVIGVFGEWGSGKTSLLQQVRDQLKSDQTSAIAWFDAWKYQYDENPVLPLLHAVVRDLGLESRQDIRRTLQVISEALGSIVLSTASRMTVTDLRSSIHAYDEAHFELRSERTRLDEYFSGLVAAALQERGSSRLVVFIDDLDRCLPDQILALLEALKLYLNRTDCVFFLAVDSQRLVQVVTGKYKDVGIDGADYLEKIVQMPFQMPRLSPSAFKDYLNELLPGDLKAAAEVLSSGLRPNPRAVKRFVNILRLQDLLAHNRGVAPYDVTVLAAVLLARSTMPEFYSRLEGDPTLLLRVAEDVQTAKGAVPDWDEQVIRLVKVLADLPQGVPADVAAYIDLATASRPPNSAAQQGMDVTPSMLRTLLRQQEPGSRLTLRGAKFPRGEDFSRIQLSRADLSKAQLAEVRLQGADLSGALLVDADLRGADLTDANLAGADLAGANLTGAILTGADLRLAELDRAVLTDVELSKAQFEDISARSGVAAPLSAREAPPPVGDDRLQAARMALIEQVGERLSQLPRPEDLVDLTLLVRGDLSELTDPFRASADMGREPTTLLPSSQILSLFQQTNQELLMIGDPGSGKTTLALRLVAELRIQAVQDPHAPVPVLLRIASWSSLGSPLRDWLAEELSERYGMPLMIANLLVDQGALICVLDGLDELGPEQQPRFIETTRSFIALSRKEHGSARMVVTTRPVGGLDLAIRLRLRGAVELRPVSQAEVSAFLQQHAHNAEARDQVQQFIQSNPEFDLSSPLLLQMLLRTFEVRGMLPSSPPELIDQFVHDQLGRLGRKGQFDPQAAETWLVALAKHLSSSERLTFSSEDSDIRSVLRDQGLRGREVPAFLRAAADQGLLSEVSENEYSFTHLLLQEYISGQLRGR